MSVWEIAQLIYRGRIELSLPIDDWVERFIDRPGVDVLPTAIELRCPLVTYDARIVRFGETHGPECGFATLG